jgi:hypothetical protein
MTDLSGNWKSFYRYPSSGRADTDFWGQHVLIASQSADALHLESGVDSPSHVVLDVRVDSDGRSVKGTWREETDPAGYYAGEVYEGTVELEITSDGRRMSGIWHGAGKDGTMNSDVWELTKDGVAQP